jgi:hypothetical protein
MSKYTLRFFLGFFLNSMVEHWNDKQPAEACWRRLPRSRMESR